MKRAFFGLLVATALVAACGGGSDSRVSVDSPDYEGPLPALKDVSGYVGTWESGCQIITSSGTGRKRYRFDITSGGSQTLFIRISTKYYRDNNCADKEMGEVGPAFPVYLSYAESKRERYGIKNSQFSYSNYSFDIFSYSFPGSQYGGTGLVPGQTDFKSEFNDLCRLIVDKATALTACTATGSNSVTDKLIAFEQLSGVNLNTLRVHYASPSGVTEDWSGVLMRK
jgi:hypothetical protein